MSTQKTKKNMGSLAKLAPIIGLVLVIIFFSITTGGKLLSVTNLQNMTSQMIVTALVSVGAVFVFGVGNFDMSMGGCVLLSAVLGAMAAVKTGSLVVTLLVCIGVAVVVALM